MERASGVLMPVSSLPGRVGIGTFGREAFDFVDFLARTHQRYWQVLPLTTTSFGDSPYQSFSAYAGNPYFIDVEDLVRLGYLCEQDLATLPFGVDPARVDYGALFRGHRALLERALPSFSAAPPEDFEAFCEESGPWLDSYCEFMAVKEEFGLKAYYEWPEQYLRRGKQSAELCARHPERVRYHKMTQYFFFRHWKRLKDYANERGVLVIGDIPIYVSRDSVEMWATPRLFRVDALGRPTCVAGTPPDQFCSTGQYWGNPIYDWAGMTEDGFGWWVERLRASLELYDILRIDHFRGFESYWSVPFGAPDSSFGRWAKGPGSDVFDAVAKRLGELPIIAEDLGFMTPEVVAMRERAGFPGMRILQFGLDSEGDSLDLPHRYVANTVAYVGTHDNETAMGWLRDTATPDAREKAVRYLALRPGETVAEGCNRAIAASVSDTCIFRMQDLLGLDNSARINTPSTVGGNWCWRMLPDAVTPEVEAGLSGLTVTYYRVPGTGAPELPK